MRSTNLLTAVPFRAVRTIPLSVLKFIYRRFRTWHGS
nr:MAG TPA: hypothetical protein [Caudoviricetes sp.]